jgi:phosphotransferase system IIA component
MVVDMNKKELLLATTVAITGLDIITIGAVSLPLTNTTTQALGQGAAISNNNNTITANAAGSALYNLTIGAKPYLIKFNITGGILDTIDIDGDQAILLVNINASTNGGKLTIELPRDLIDSKMQSDTDKPYSVYEDDTDRPMSFIESKTTEKARTLVITFNNEDDVIEIQGTEVLSKPGGEF